MTAHALRAVEIIIGVALALGTLELLHERALLADDGVWRWQTIAPEMGWLRPLLAYRPFLGVLAVRLGGALALVAGARGPVAPVLWITTLLVNVRFRGTFNGGSDLMTMVVLTSLVVAHLFGHSALAVNAALLYIAAQGMLSYFVAGVVKLTNPDWRDGTALRQFVSRPSFGAPLVVQRAARSSAVVLLASWTVMLWEVTFPAAFASVPGVWAYVAIAFVFHLTTVLVFGINRFLVTWAATWPAIIWTARVL